MICGLDKWPTHKMKRISEPALEAILNIDELLEPPSASEDSSTECAIPALRFPEWMSCSQCGRMGTVYKGHFHENSSGVAICSANSCTGFGMPARFIVACEGKDKKSDQLSHHGHISDFPWERWCHLKLDDPKEVKTISCDTPQIYLESIKGRTGLDGLRVRCRSCKNSNTLRKALSADHNHLFSCKGEMPWLRLSGVKRHPCDSPARVLLRGASNTYFPVSKSVISIPPWTDPLFQKMAYDKNTDGFITSIKAGLDASLFTPLIKKLPWAEGYSDTEITNALCHFAAYGKHEGDTTNDRLTEERNAIIKGHICEAQGEDQFLSRPILDSELGELESWIENLVQVERLREVRALSGFTRVHDSTGADCIAPLTSNRTWLPAINVFGEGIYFELSQDRLRELEINFAERLAPIKRRVADEEIHESIATASFIALHTLSHLLIRQLSLECGYSSAALRERLYVKEGQWAGVLIYTASSSSDGTLGGLVEQGRPLTLAKLIRDALNEASWCSSDPLCSSSEGQGNQALNLAACHACSLVAETSCSERNSLLDRCLLIGKDKTPGFFEGF